ncbi:MAG: dihydropteroate synthase [Deltaproteobacteria bacterium]|nr:MAG: dihydropteroate synthase [Deltaproteobacteria bacterium]
MRSTRLSVKVHWRRPDHNGRRKTFSLRCRGGGLKLGEKTLVMGVLNVTPDSFSDGGLFFEPAKAIEHGLKMAEEGADIIDVGGESSRPGSDPLPLDEELRRVIPVIEELASRLKIPISVDTYKSQVAERAIEAGAQMINDISGLRFDPQMAYVAARYDSPLIIMHIKGTPKTMQQEPFYEDLMGEIIAYLHQAIEKATSAGVDPQQVIVDPGIGFGKRVQDNLVILNRLHDLNVLGRPILIGTSRKSFIGAVLGLEVHQRMIGTLATVAVAAMKGAHIVRVHDVAPVKQVVDMVDAIINAEV